MDALSKFARTTLLGVLAAATLVGCGSDDSGTGDTGAAGKDPLVLTLPAATADMKCAVPSADLLQTADTAFEATVSGIDEAGDTTLSVSHWMQGADQPADVTIEAPEADLSGLVPVVTFEEGKDYLVTATDGAVSVCGLSGEKTPELSELYAEAFGH